MIELDISNLWTCVTLPELLGSEKQIFDAHLQLRNHEPDGPDFMNWLRLPESATARLIHGIRRKADQICRQSDVLIVCGSGHIWSAARAAISCYCGTYSNLLRRPQVFFTGDSISGRQWTELQSLMDAKDISLHIISPTGQDLAANITARGLRWMMERKYGAQCKERISVATSVGTPLHTMGQEEGYELFPMPKEAGGTHSALTAAALLPMAVAGIDPLSVLEGAVEADEVLDIRSFENPAWLYAAARTVLLQKGRSRELLCVYDHSLRDLGRWWQQYVRRHQPQTATETALLPEDSEPLDAVLSAGGRGVFETMLHFDPIPKKIPIEMDWKDYDGLGFLSGRHWDYVEAQHLAATAEAHNAAGIPVLDIHAGELSAQSLGGLFCFFELSCALSASMSGTDPFAPIHSLTHSAVLDAMGGIQ